MATISNGRASTKAKSGRKSTLVLCRAADHSVDLYHPLYDVSLVQMGHADSCERGAGPHRRPGRPFGHRGLISACPPELVSLRCSGSRFRPASLCLSTSTNSARAGTRLMDAAIEGAVLRLRPIMMTMLVATLGLLPAALSHAIGSDSQRPFAIVIVGGLISDLLMSIILMPTFMSGSHETATGCQSRRKPLRGSKLSQRFIETMRSVGRSPRTAADALAGLLGEVKTISRAVARMACIIAGCILWLMPRAGRPRAAPPGLRWTTLFNWRSNTTIICSQRVQPFSRAKPRRSPPISARTRRCLPIGNTYLSSPRRAPLFSITCTIRPKPTSVSAIYSSAEKSASIDFKPRKMRPR